MKRSAALIALTLALAACGSSRPQNTAIHARLHPKSGAVDVWRDDKRRITFHLTADTFGAVTRYDPSTRVLSEFGEGTDFGSTRYRSKAGAWATITGVYGLSEPKVEHALDSAVPSSDPIDYGVDSTVTAPAHANSQRLYGTDVARMAEERGLIVPRLGLLLGYPLSDASVIQGRNWRGLASVQFGKFGIYYETYIGIDIAKVVPGDPGAPGNLYRRSYREARRYYRVAGTRYTIDSSGLTFPYHGEWILVEGGGPETHFEDVPQTDEGLPYLDITKRPAAAEIVRSIVTAPTY